MRRGLIQPVAHHPGVAHPYRPTTSASSSQTQDLRRATEGRQAGRKPAATTTARRTATRNPSTFRFATIVPPKAAAVVPKEGQDASSSFAQSTQRSSDAKGTGTNVQ